MKKLFTCFVALLASSSFLMAADIVVTTVADNASGEDVIDGSFRAAVSQVANGDVIKFAPIDGNTIELKQKIGFSAADMKIIVDGLLPSGQPLTITKSSDAAAGTRMINIANGAGSPDLSVTLKNISFENIVATGNGAVISSGNSAYSTGANAGTTFNVTLENCRFINCSTTIDSGSSSGGGAAYFINHGTQLIIKNCLFANNRVTFSAGPDASKSFGGGAISSTGSGTARMTIINSTFYGCYSDGRGGAVFTGHPTDLINCTFAGNTGQRGAGYYYHNNQPGTVINSIFAYNYGMAENYTENGDFLRNNGALTFHNNIIGKTNLTEEQLAVGANNLLFIDVQPLFDSYTTDEANNKVPVLADNGGWYETVALKQGGVASGTGVATVAGFAIPTTDQRGYARKTPPSIGAYEYGATSAIESQKTVSGDIIVSGSQIVIAVGVKGSVSVYNLAGKTVYSAKVNGGGTISSLPQGAYIVKLVESTGASAISKVLLK